VAVHTRYGPRAPETKVVLDAVAKSSFGRCRRPLRPGGSYR
jgi:hypothetical protein